MKDLIQFQCLVKDPKKCHVTVNKYKARKLPLVHISADVVSFPKNIRIESVLSVKAENAIRVQASIVCPRISFYTPKGLVIISAEGILRTTVVVSVARKTYVEGQICYQEKIKRKITQEEVDIGCSLPNLKQGSITEEDTSVSQSTIDDSLKSREIPGSCLKVTIDGDLHIRTDGKIGMERTNNVHEHSVVTQLTLSVSGDIHNFGKVSAALILDIKAQNILTGRQCKEDTVQRYFERIEERLGLFNTETEFECEPTSSSLLRAVNSCQVPLIPALLRMGADPNAPTGKDKFVPTSIASKKLSEGFVTDNYGGYSDKRDSPDYVASLLKAWGKRSGMIFAPSINCHMSGDIQDCSQLIGKTVHFMVGGDLVVEEDSIWTSGFVSGTCSGNFIVNGIVKFDKFKTFKICKEFMISEIGKILTAKGGEVIVGERFCNMNRMLNAQEQLDITTNIFEQYANALLGSKAKLKLTIQGNSSQCEGQIKGEKVLFNIAANVESKCDINAEEVCIIEIAEGVETKRFGHFLNKGIINVKDGDLVAVRKIKTRVSDTPDITMEGKVISKGVRASSIHIRTMKSSKIEIHPNPKAAAEIPSINCLTGSLTTEPGSLLHLITDTENRDVIFRCCDKWNHYGELVLIKSAKEEGLYDTSGYFEVFQTYNWGKIENCDNINLLVQEQFNNYTNLSAQKEIIITGSGEICNKSESSINCSAGPIKMNNIGWLTNEGNASIRGQTFEATTVSVAMLTGKNQQLKMFNIQNQGLVVGVHDVKINAENISNTYGTIQSCTGCVQLMWTTERHKSVEISGTVLSPVAVAFVVKEAEYFVCQCVGGEVEQVDGFALPKGGLLIECKYSNVIFSTSVHGDADVKVLSKWNIHVLKDMQVRSFQVEATGKDVFHKNKDMVSTIYENSAKHEEETKDTKESNKQHLERDDETIMPVMMIANKEVNEQVTKEDSINMNEFEKMLEPSSDSNFCVYVGKESNLSCKKMTFTSEFHTNIRIQTMQGSKVICEKIFSADSGVIFDCSLQVLHGSSLIAYGVEITKNAELSIAKSDADVESNVDIYFVNCFENYGNIYNKDNTLCHLHIWCIEDEYSTMKNNLQTPSEAKLKSSSALLSGTVTISGNLQLVNVDQVQIDKEASLSCEGFHIPETENKSITSLLIERGCLKVQGPCTCFLKKLTIQEHGVFKHISDKDDYGCHIEVSHSATLSGRLEFNLKGKCLLRCKESLICKSLHAEIDSNRFKIIASQSVVIDSDSHMFVKRGNLCITNAEDDDTQVNGEIEICGKIAEVFPQSGELLSGKSEPDEIPCGNSECDEIPSRKSSLEIEGCKVFLNGAHLTGFNKTELFAAESMMIDPTSKLKGGHEMEIDIASLEVKGEIKEYEILHFKPRTMLVTGKIHKCNKITIEAEYAAVNCGEIHGKHTGIVAPIYLNCPEFPDGNVQSSINMVSQLGDDEQKELIVEGLLCIIVGSQLQGTNINIKSVLRFEFASKKSTVPSSSELDNWKNVVNTSLSKMYSSIDPSGVEKLVEQVASIPKVICKLGVASHLCSDIVQMSQNIRNRGLADFNIENLVGSLNKAHEEYSRISSFSIQVNIRPKLRKLKDATARTARCLMNKCFGSSSFGNRPTFKDDSDIEEGIEATSFIFQGENTDLLTEGNYIADSLTFNGGKGSWKNQGHLEVCGDIFISAKTVYHKGSRVKQVIAGGSLLVEAQDLEMESIKAKKLQAKATRSAKINSAEISDESVIDSDKVVVIENVKTKDLHVRGEELASIKSVKAVNDVVISGGDIAVDDLEAKRLQTDASKSTLIESAYLTEDALIQGKGDIKVSDVKALNLDVTGESSADIKKASIDNNLALKASGDVKANSVNTTNMVIDGKRDISIGDVKAKGSVQAKSAKGCISLDSKIEANLLRLDADKVSLTGKAGKADHQLKTLSVKTQQIQNIDRLLNKSGVYKDMQISDQLDLAVEDQNVVLANIRKWDFDLSLRAASIDVVSNVRSDHNVQLQATKQDITLHQGSSVSSSKKVYMESEKGSVNITAAGVHGEHSVTMKAEKDVNIMAVGGNQSAQKSKVSAGTGEDEFGLPAIAIKAGRDIKVHASEVTSEGTNQFIAGRDIKLTAHTYQTVHRKRKSSWFGLKKRTTTTTTTHVDKSNIRGRTNIFKAGGEFTSIANNIQSEDGNLIHAKGNVSFKDIVATQTVNTSTKVLGGLLYSKDENKTSESSYGTLVEDSSALARTKIISDTSNIEWIGSSMKTPGNFTEIAHRGKVIHSKRILTKTYQTTESGFYFNNPNTGEGVGFGYKFQHTDGRSQSTSDDSVQVGGNYSIEAKEFEALNSFSFNVNGDMTVDARKITFAGAELKSSEDSGGFGIGLSDTAIEATVNFSHQHGTQQQSQNLDTGGTFRMVNVEDASFINSKANVGAMAGDVKNMNVISRADSAFKVKTEIGIGFDLVTRTPTASLNIDTGISNVVKQQASINVQSDSNGLSVKTLTLTGAEITFDGDVHDFADNIVSHDVHEIDNEFGLGFDISKKVATGKSVKKMSLAVHHSQGRLGSCVTSMNGEVHQSIRKKINTDMDKCRVVDAKFGFAITHKFKGNLSKNASAIGKSIAKSVGKDALKACGKRLVSELGLPDDIANAIVDIASGNAPLRETLIFMAGKACIPKDLIDAIEDLILKKDPTKLLIWICRKSGIDHSIVGTIMDVVQKGNFDQESFLRIAKHVGKLLNLSEDIVIILEQLVRDKQKGVSTTLTIQTVTMGLIKSPEGQWITKKLCNITGISDDIANLIVAFFKQRTLAEKGIIILQAVGVQLKLPEKLLEGLREAVLHHEFKSLLQWVCKEIGMDQHLVVVVVDSIRNKKNKDLKEILHYAARCIAKYLGISDNVITDVETRVAGKQPKDGILMLILNILDDLSKSKQFLAARKMLFEKLETFCQDLRIPKNILKTVSDLSQQIAAGKKPTAAIPLVLYLLESFGVTTDLIDGIRSLLQNRDPRHLANWLAVKLGFDPELFSLLTKGVVEEKSMKQIIIAAIKYYCIKYNMPAKLTDNITKIIDEDLPKCYKILKDNLCQKTQKQFDVGHDESKRIAKDKHHQTKHGITSTLEHHKHQHCDPVQGRPVENIERKGHQNTEKPQNTASVGKGHENFSLEDNNKNQEGQGSVESMSKESFETNESKQIECLNSTKQVEDAIRCDLGEMPTKIAEDSKIKQLFEEYGEIIQETNEGRILFKALCALDGTEDSLIKLFYPLSEEIGIPETIVTGILDLVMRKDPTNLAIWLGGVVSIETDLIVAFFKAFHQNKLEEIVPIVMKGICLVFGLSKTTIKTIEKIFRKDLKANEMKDCFIKIAFETITPKVQKLAVDAGIPDFLVELLVSIVDIEKPMDLQKLLRKLLEHLVSMFNIPSDVVNQISVLCTNISKGQYKQTVVQLVLFLLQRISLPKAIIDIVDGLFKKDTTALVRWLARRFDIDKQILTKLASDVENGAPFIAIIKDCIKIVCMKLKLPLAVITDIQLILEEKPPENALKAFEEFLKGNYDVISKEAALCKCKELNLPLIFIDCVETVFKENSSCDKAINLFVILTSVCGVPEDFSVAIADVFFRKDKTKIFVWVEKETRIKPVLSEAIVDTILSLELNMSSARRLLKGGCLSVGLSNTTSDRVQAIFDSNLPKKDTRILVIDIAIEISLPHISKAIEQCVGIPSDIVDNLLRILRLYTTFEQCSKLIETLALKLGMPEDLVKSIHALVCDQNNCLIAVWISNKIGINKGLVLSVLDTLRSSQSLLEAVKKLPACLFKYLGLSNEVINKIETLMDNKLSASEIPKLLTLVTAELFKTKVDKDIVDMVTHVITTEDWFDRVMHFVRYIANTYNIPIECVDGVGDLIKKKDPTKIAMWLADKMGVNQKVMVSLAKAVLRSKDPKQIMRDIAKAAGIPEEAVLVLEEMIKRNTGKLSKKCAITGSHSGTRIK